MSEDSKIPVRDSSKAAKNKQYYITAANFSMKAYVLSEY